MTVAIIVVQNVYMYIQCLCTVSYIQCLCTVSYIQCLCTVSYIRCLCTVSYVRPSNYVTLHSVCLYCQMIGLHHSSSKHAPASHQGISSATSSPNSDLKIVTMSLAKENESGTLGISIIGGKVSRGDIILTLC